ncbi:hypothetical protein, partial [Helicobacter ganmani]|uniref:hypothetical protein n=1 Tax=Helicobacter ganmani TaxID=60246 RepID=UPI003A873B90
MLSKLDFAFSIQQANKSIFIFANDKDYIDCDTIHSQIYKKIQDKEEHKNISLEELQNLEFEILKSFK